MNLRKIVAWSSILVVSVVLVVSASAQKGNQTKKITNPYMDAGEFTGQVRVEGATIKYDHPLPQVDAASSANWPLHNLDLAGSRFSSLDQINVSNIKSLTPRWLFQTGVIGGSFHTAPVVVDGVMYVTDPQGSIYAVDAVTGDQIWKFNIGNLIGGGEAGIANRGVAYGDGTVYVAAGPSVFAVDAKTGKAVQTFGNQGRADVLQAVLKAKYPDLQEPVELGYAFTAAPQYYNGMIFIGSSLSESNIPGGLFFALDAKTGQIIWKFNTVPQAPEDEGWEIAKDTWVGGVRNGGGVWETPAIDPELGMIYLMVSNPSPDVDGSARKGINLFTNSIVALEIATGKIKWYFQQLHHDLWDWDSVCPTMLLDLQIGGRTVKAVAEAQKNGFLYILDRQTGQSILPIKEDAVPTTTNVPGEEVWPTQPIPRKANGQPMEPFRPVLPTGVSPDRISQAVPFLTPFPTGSFVIEVGSSANYGACSFSPQTGLIYVTAIDSVSARGVTPVGASLRPGQSSLNWTTGPAVRPSTGTLSAYDPVTGERVWQAQLPAPVQGGSVATAGNLVFIGDASGYVRSFDGRTGVELWKFNAGAAVAASPTVYMVNGEQFVSVAAGSTIFSPRRGDTIVTFALPKP
jgi:PQQ-dependent dehydrogenase (methanol/ethanol family)